MAPMLDFPRYLEAKRSVDDRALDQRVVDRLRRELEEMPTPALLDVGCGTGIGVDRLLSWGVVSSPRVTAVDRNAELVAAAENRLRARIGGTYVASTLETFAAEGRNREGFDLVVAHAVLDDVDLPDAIGHLLALTRPGGLLYCPITFDGESIFEPADPDDQGVLTLYHASMEQTGSPRTGRRLFEYLRDEDVEILSVGSSDWIVFADDGTYPAEEAFFLEAILSFVETAVGEPALEWAKRRRRQLADGSLVYIAHQLDFLVRKRG